MKKISTLILVLVSVLALSFALTACGGGTDAPTVMTHSEYVAAEIGTSVTIEAYVQAKQGYWENDGQGLATIYLQDENGGYLV